MIFEGHDFSTTPADARQYAADKLFTALLNIMPEIEREIDRRKDTGNDEYWLELDRIAAARAPHLPTPRGSTRQIRRSHDPA